MHCQFTHCQTLASRDARCCCCCCYCSARAAHEAPGKDDGAQSRCKQEGTPSSQSSPVPSPALALRSNSMCQDSSQVPSLLLFVARSETLYFIKTWRSAILPFYATPEKRTSGSSDCGPCTFCPDQPGWKSPDQGCGPEITAWGLTNRAVVVGGLADAKVYEVQAVWTSEERQELKLRGEKACAPAFSSLGVSRRGADCSTATGRALPGLQRQHCVAAGVMKYCARDKTRLKLHPRAWQNS